MEPCGILLVCTRYTDTVKQTFKFANYIIYFSTLENYIIKEVSQAIPAKIEIVSQFPTMEGMRRPLAGK